MKEKNEMMTGERLQRCRIIYALLLMVIVFLALPISGYAAGYQPEGVVDSVRGLSGGIYVEGWAFDRDDLSAGLKMQVYIGGSYDTQPANVVYADKERADVNEAYPGVGNYHGFSNFIKTDLRGTQMVYIYAMGVGEGYDKLLAKQEVYIGNPMTATVSPSSTSIEVGESICLTTKFQGDGIYQLKWGTSGNDYTEFGSNAVDWGQGTFELNVIGKKAGNDTISIGFYAEDDTLLLEKNVSIKVIQPLQGITLNKTSLSLSKGENAWIVASPSPSDATFESGVTWTSSNTSVAIVDSFGIVEAIGGGTATITAKTGSYSATCSVKVDYTVTYNANGGTGAPSATAKTPGFTAYLSSTTPTRTNYTFNGWNTKADGSGTGYAAGAAYTTNADVTLYAQWKAVTYTILYNANGGTGAPSSQTKYQGTTLTLTTLTPTRTGYEFVKWNTNQSGTGTSYLPGASYTANASASLYAQWKEKTYTVSYNSNGGSSGPSASQTKYYFSDLKLSTAVPTRTGYDFAGWNTRQDGTGTAYASGATYAANAEVTLYAQWKQKSYPVTYDANGGTGGPSAQEKLYNTTLTLTTTIPSRTGYTFTGWNTYAGGYGTAYQPGGSYTYNQSLTLYAQWKLTDYTITYQLFGGSNHYLNPSSYTMTSSVTLYSPTRTGYKFVKWYNYSTGEKMTSISTGSTGNLTIAAEWTPITYSISLSGNGASSGSMSEFGTKSCFYDAIYSLPASEYIREGYTFEGWNTRADGSGTTYQAGASVRNLTTTDKGTVTLYAKWSPINYDITYVLDGGSNNAANPAAYHAETETITLKSASRKGYTFKGWYLEDTYTTKVTQIVKGTTGSKTFYAKWTPNIYTIEFDGNGAKEGELLPLSNRKYDQDYTLRANVFVKTGYTFGGWNTKADGSGDAYADKASVRNLTAVSNGVVTMYAQWIPNTYSVKFSGNGSTSGSTKTMTGCEYGLTYLLGANGFKKTDFDFAGWNTKADGTGKTYADKQLVKNLTSTNGKTVTLYAQWVPAAYTITYEMYGGVNVIANPDSYTVESPDITLASPSRIGYTFKGWYGESTFETRISKIATGSRGDRILYAKWTPNTYTIVFDGNGASSGEMAELPKRNYGTDYTLRTNAYGKTGYVFDSWNTRADGKGTAYANKEVVSNLSAVNGAIVTLYAQWKPITYIIKFSGNGSTSGSTKAMTDCAYGASCVLRTNGFKKTGHAFTGWNTKADGSGRAYTDMQSVKNLANTQGASITLYAQWKENAYNIVFDGNGCDSGSMSQLMNRLYSKSYTLPINAFKKTGYSFNGWNTLADGSGISIENRQTVAGLSDIDGATVVLYAQWKARTYSIVFDGNGAGSGSMDVLVGCVYDTKYTLAANAFKRTGYNFGGWNTKADGTGTKYANKETVSNLANTEGKIVTLYAQWKLNTYTITYEVNGGSNSSANPGFYTVVTDSITLAAPTRTGYTFKGWYKEDTFANKVTKISLGSTGNKVFYAKWAANTYTAAFDGNGATSGELAPLSGRIYDKSFALRANTYTRTGYEFTGWNTGADGTGTAFGNKASVSNLTSENGATVTLYAQWKPIEYQISYQLYGGKNSSKNPVSYNVETSTITLATPTRKGFIFNGWFMGGSRVTKIVKGTSGDLAIEANWEPIRYNIAFDGNGATSGKMSDWTGLLYNAAYTMRSSDYKKSGYTFIGWNTKADGTGTGYEAGVQFREGLTDVDGATITLYAQWEKK